MNSRISVLEVRLIASNGDQIGVVETTKALELAKAEEKISKQKAKQLFDSGDIEKIETGTFKGLAFIHKYLFEDIYVKEIK